MGKSMVEYLVSNKADVNIKDNYGQTPLHRAAFGGEKLIVEYLVSNKAAMNIKDNKGNFPMSICLKKKVMTAKEILELIHKRIFNEEKKASQWIQKKLGSTGIALQLAIQLGFLQKTVESQIEVRGF